LFPSDMTAPSSGADHDSRENEETRSTRKHGPDAEWATPQGKDSPLATEGSRPLHRGMLAGICLLSALTLVMIWVIASRRTDKSPTTQPVVAEHDATS